MRTLVLLSLTTPGAIAGYMVLMGYLLNRIRPVPITFIPEQKVVPFRATGEDDSDDGRQAVAV